MAICLQRGIGQVSYRLYTDANVTTDMIALGLMEPAPVEAPERVWLDDLIDRVWVEDDGRAMIDD